MCFSGKSILAPNLGCVKKNPYLVLTIVLTVVALELAETVLLVVAVGIGLTVELVQAPPPR